MEKRKRRKSEGHTTHPRMSMKLLKKEPTPRNKTQRRTEHKKHAIFALSLGLGFSSFQQNRRIRLTKGQNSHFIQLGTEWAFR